METIGKTKKRKKKEKEGKTPKSSGGA